MWRARAGARACPRHASRCEMAEGSALATNPEDAVAVRGHRRPGPYVARWQSRRLWRQVQRPVRISRSSWAESAHVGTGLEGKVRPMRTTSVASRLSRAVPRFVERRGRLLATQPGRINDGDPPIECAATFRLEETCPDEVHHETSSSRSLRGLRDAGRMFGGCHESARTDLGTGKHR